MLTPLPLTPAYYEVLGDTYPRIAAAWPLMDWTLRVDASGEDYPVPAIYIEGKWRVPRAQPDPEGIDLDACAVYLTAFDGHSWHFGVRWGSYGNDARTTDETFYAPPARFLAVFKDWLDDPDTGPFVEEEVTDDLRSNILAELLLRPLYAMEEMEEAAYTNDPTGDLAPATPASSHADTAPMQRPSLVPADAGGSAQFVLDAAHPLAAHRNASRYAAHAYATAIEDTDPSLAAALRASFTSSRHLRDLSRAALRPFALRPLRAEVGDDFSVYLHTSAAHLIAVVEALWRSFALSPSRHSITPIILCDSLAAAQQLHGVFMYRPSPYNVSSPPPLAALPSPPDPHTALSMVRVVSINPDPAATWQQGAGRMGGFMHHSLDAFLTSLLPYPNSSDAAPREAVFGALLVDPRSQGVFEGRVLTLAHSLLGSTLSVFRVHLPTEGTP